MYFYVLLDNGYYASLYSSGQIYPSTETQSVIYTDILPESVEYDNLRQQALKWENGTWVFYQEKYDELLAAQVLAWVPSLWGSDVLQAKIEYISMMTGYNIYCNDTNVETVDRLPFRKTRSYYRYKHWTKDMVRMAVVKEWITADEYKDITGEDYIAN